MPLAVLTANLDAFCYGFYRATVQHYAGGMMGGDPDIGPPKPILGKMMVEGGGSVIYGPPGPGQELHGARDGCLLDADVNTVWPVSGRRVGYVNLERSADSMSYRLSQINKALGLPLVGRWPSSTPAVSLSLTYRTPSKR